MKTSTLYFLISLIVSSPFSWGEHARDTSTSLYRDEKRRPITNENDSPRCDALTEALKARVEKALNWVVDEEFHKEPKSDHTTALQDSRFTTERLKHVLESVGELGKTQNKDSSCRIPRSTLKNWIQSPEAYKDLKNMLEAKRTSLEKLGLSPEKIAQVFPWKREEQNYSLAAEAMQNRILNALKSILAETES